MFQFLNEDVLVDTEICCLKRKVDGKWVVRDDPLLELVTVLYLINVDDIYPIGKDIVGVKDLKEAHFFQGPHALRTEPLNFIFFAFYEIFFWLRLVRVR